MSQAHFTNTVAISMEALKTINKPEVFISTLVKLSLGHAMYIHPVEILISVVLKKRVI